MLPYYAALLCGGQSRVTAFDPAHCAAEITLSNNNLTATQNANVGTRSVRTTTSVASGKWYWEVHIDQSAGGPRIGLALEAAGTSGALGADANSIGYQGFSGNVSYNGSTVSTIQTWTAGDIVSVAADLTNNLFWFNVNNGNWNNSGAASPATGVGGVSMALGTAGVSVRYPVVQITGSATNGFTANFSDTTYTPPAGFFRWDE